MMSVNENVALNAEQERDQDDHYDYFYKQYKESEHFAEEIDKAIERREFERIFVRNQPMTVAENRYVEFKEIKGQNPVDSIKNTADEYAVAFLNKQGGSIFWGIRDSDRVVVGVQLDHQKKDDICRTVSNKFAQIQPRIPVSDFNLDFHAISDEQGKIIDDLWIFEVNVPQGLPTVLYATGGNEVHVRTDGGKQKLDFLQVVAEIERRKGLSKNEARDPDEDVMFTKVVELTMCARTNTGDAWFPVLGSDDHKLAEKMVRLSLLERIPGGLGGYTLPGRINFPWRK
jgi:hypothetical protein